MNAAEKEVIDSVVYVYRPYDLALVLPFVDAMRVASRLNRYGVSYDPYRHYAVELLYGVRERFIKEWNQDWRHDIYLSIICFFANRYDERYRACQRALKKVSPPPPELLVQYASCSDVPGIPSVSREEAVNILQAVARKKPYHDVVRMLVRGCYDEFELPSKELRHWEKIFLKQEKSGKYENLPSLFPPILEGGIETDLSKLPPPPQRDRDEELFDIAKRVYFSEPIPPAVRGIVVEWAADEIITWVYHAGDLAIELTPYERIAAYYLKDYSIDNDRGVRIDPPEELPHHKRWVYFK
ncbi:MAG: hypothetical protein JSR80_00290 [Verrucomicrobia bacterium]|nr:hypothetical protein [Verrucomicrobiota bacterium]